MVALARMRSRTPVTAVSRRKPVWTLAWVARTAPKMATPSEPPIWRAVLRTPLAVPARSAGMASMISAVSGGTVDALGTRPARIALMTAIGVTKHTPGHDWKRRGERLVRASGRPYTIVRPGWSDYNAPDQQSLVMLQGDRRWAGDPSDGVVSRAQIAQVLVASLTSDAAVRKTLELVAEHGPAQGDLDPLFAALPPDPLDALDGVLDRDNMPLQQEPPSVTRDLDSIRGSY